MKGCVWLVGAGPGDGGLLTLKGARLLARADAVAYDRLVSPEVLSMARSDALMIDVGKRSGDHPVPQSEIQETLRRLAERGQMVVRLKGGDPYLFGRGGEEFIWLRERGIPVGVVPGVTSAFGAAAAAGIPVTHRDLASSVTVVTARGKRGGDWRPDWSALARLGGTLIFLMGLSALEEIVSGLMIAGLSPETPAAVVERGSTAAQRVVRAPLGRLTTAVRAAELDSPALTVVGRVAALDLEVGDLLPLRHRRVIVTRRRADAPALATLLADAGAQVVVTPTIDLEADFSSPDLANFDPKEVGAAAFTSPRAVEFFFLWLAETGRDVRELAGLTIAAVGPSTARALRDRGLQVDLVPDRFDGGALGEALSQRAEAKRGVVAFRAADSSPGLAAALADAGCRLVDLPLYHNVAPVTPIAAPEADWVAFASASAADRFAGRFGCPENLRALCIGPTTEAAARRAGFRTLMARVSTLESMVQTLIEATDAEERLAATTRKDDS